MNNQSQPMGDVVRALVRWAWAILAAAVAVGLLVFGGQRFTQTDGTTVQARAGLTDSAEWPLFNAELELFRNRVTDPALLQELGIDDDVEIEATSIDQTFLVDVDVTAETEDVASDVMNKVIDSVLTSRTDERLETFTSRLEQATLAHDDLVSAIEADRGELERIEAELRDVSAQLDIEYAFSVDESRARLGTERRVVATRIDERERDLIDAADNISDIRVEQARIGSWILVVREPFVVDNGALDLTTPVAAALATAVAAAAVALWFDRERGKVRSAWQLERLLGIPELARLDGAGIGDLEHDRRFIDALGRSARTAGVWWSGTTDHVSQTGALRPYVSPDPDDVVVEHGYCPLVDDEGESPEPHPLALVDLGNVDIGRRGAPEGHDHCDVIVLGVTFGSSSMAEVRRQMHDLGRSEIVVAGAIVVT